MPRTASRRIFRTHGASGRLWRFRLARDLADLPLRPGLFVLLGRPRPGALAPEPLLFGLATRALADEVPRHPLFEAAIRLGLDGFGSHVPQPCADPAEDLAGQLADLEAGTPTPLAARSDALREIAELTALHRAVARPAARD